MFLCRKNTGVYFNHPSPIQEIIFFPNTKEHALTRQAAEGVARGGGLSNIHVSIYLPIRKASDFHRFLLSIAKFRALTKNSFIRMV